MDFATRLAALQTEGDRFAAAIGAAAPDSAIPTCPGWTMRDLVLHQGEVHRWATTIVRNAVPKPSAVGNDHLGELPDDASLRGWFVAGHAALVDALAAAPDDLRAFTFLADSLAPRDFWMRRQLHETGIHRVDAESATGSFTPFDPSVAADGIDEMLAGFAPRPHTPLHTEVPVTMQVLVDDAPGQWLTTIGPGAPVTERATGDATCTVQGGACQTYRALWNRSDTSQLRVDGDATVLDTFRENVRISWR